MINLRFGPTTWDSILMERKRRIDARKQAIQKAKADKLRKQREMYELIRIVSIGIVVMLFVIVVVGVMIKFVFAHTILDQNDQSCKIFEPRYFLICLSEGKEAATIEFELDQKKNKGNWIVDDD